MKNTLLGIVLILIAISSPMGYYLMYCAMLASSPAPEQLEGACFITFLLVGISAWFGGGYVLKEKPVK